MDPFRVNADLLYEYGDALAVLVQKAQELADELKRILSTATLKNLPMFQDDKLRRLMDKHNENMCRMAALRKMLEQTADTYMETEQRNLLMVDMLPETHIDFLGETSIQGVAAYGYIPPVNVQRETASFDLFNANSVYTEDWLAKRMDDSSTDASQSKAEHSNDI